MRIVRSLTRLRFVRDDMLDRDDMIEAVVCGVSELVFAERIL